MIYSNKYIDLASSANMIFVGLNLFDLNTHLYLEQNNFNFSFTMYHVYKNILQQL